MSDQDYDQFQDIVNAATGIFEGSGLRAHDSVSTAVRPEGVVLEFVCQGCSRGQQVTLEWPEVIALKYGVDPAFAYRGRQDIVRSPMSFKPLSKESAWAPQETCSNDGWHYALRIFFDEPERWLQQARRAGYIGTQAEQQLSQFATQIAARARAPQQQMGPQMAPGMVRR